MSGRWGYNQVGLLIVKQDMHIPFFLLAPVRQAWLVMGGKIDIQGAAISACCWYDTRLQDLLLQNPIQFQEVKALLITF